MKIVMKKKILRRDSSKKWLKKESYLTGNLLLLILSLGTTHLFLVWLLKAIKHGNLSVKEQSGLLLLSLNHSYCPIGLLPKTACLRPMFPIPLTLWCWEIPSIWGRLSSNSPSLSGLAIGVSPKNLKRPACKKVWTSFPWTQWRKWTLSCRGAPTQSFWSLMLNTSGRFPRTTRITKVLKRFYKSKK